VAAEPGRPSQNQCLHDDSKPDSCDSRTTLRSRRTGTHQVTRDPRVFDQLSVAYGA
jgi:hypothetical protein